MVTVVVTIAGGVIDLTAAQLHHAQDQAAADAASLTAASEVELALRSFDTPVQALAQANDAGTHIAASDGCGASCTVTFQYEEANGSVAPTVADATEVTATLVDGSSPLAFGSIPGLGPIALTLYATALIPTGSSELALGCTVCTLGSSGTGGNLTFTPGVTIPPICVLLVCAPTVTASLEQTLNVTGTIQANGDTGVISPAGLNLNVGDGVMSSGFTATGTASYPAGWTVSPGVVTGAAVAPDPLQNSLPPSDAGLSVQGTNGVVTLPSTGGTLSPGFYSEICGSGLNSATVTFQPGTYFIIGSGAGSSTSSCSSFGSGLYLNDASGSGTSTVTGTGVTFFFGCGSILSGVAMPTACTPGEVGPNVTLTGSIDPSLNAPTSGTGQNLLFYFDRNDTGTLSISLLPFTITGSPGFYGSIYGRSMTAAISTGLATVNTTAITDLTSCITSAITSLNLTVAYLTSCLGSLSGLMNLSIGSLIVQSATFSGTLVQYNLYDSTPVDAGLGQSFLTVNP